MELFLFKALIALALVSICSANLADNQIEDKSSWNLGRARYSLKACKPCASDKCQVMGMQRFAEPRCETFGGVGSPCRPFQVAENKTLSFPNSVLYCDQVYMQFCPCAQNLICDPDRAECRFATRKRPSKPQAQQQPKRINEFTHTKPERLVSQVVSRQTSGETEAKSRAEMPSSSREFLAQDAPFGRLGQRGPQWPRGGPVTAPSFH